MRKVELSKRFLLPCVDRFFNVDISLKYSPIKVGVAEFYVRELLKLHIK